MSNKGESIIEVVIVAFFLASMFTALVSLVIMSVSRNRLAKERTVATRLAQQGMEWLRSERDFLGYGDFENKMSVGSGNFCIVNTDESLGSFSPPTCTTTNPDDSGDCSKCADASLGYKRWVAVTFNPPQIDVTMHVVWGKEEITQTGVLSQWQR
jgi:Tfp pilus assembly protein PilV